MIKKIISFLILGLFFIVQAKVLFAQSGPTQLPISIANSRNELIVDPGESSRVQLKIYNGADSPVAGEVKVVDFIVEDSQGTPLLIEDPIPNSNRFSAASWMSVSASKIAIGAKDKATVDVFITVPYDARPGGRYAAVLFEVTGTTLNPKDSPQTESASVIAPRVASLFYIRIAGDAKELAILSNFKTPSLSESGPIPVSFEIANRGDIHIKPKGLITISDWYGRNIFQEKIEEVNIFPDASRMYETKTGKDFMIGRYKIKIAASYGDQGKVLEGISYSWVIPWKLITVIALTLAILIVLFNSFRKKTIIHQHELENKLKNEEEELKKLKDQLKDKF